MKINKKIIKELTEYLDEFDLTELEYSDKDYKIKVSKNSLTNNYVAKQENKKNTTIENKNSDLGKEITSPIIGTAYLAPEPGGKKFIDLGKKIKKGDTVVIVEAMKTMNHIPSPFDGIVKEICVEDGQPIEFGQKIAIID
tara:strand:+ start:1130 stop:1549 length:420 start_codon:yes stop_codon:yes gene_type:complete